MKQLDQRVSKLEKAMNERPPNLAGKSVEDLMKLLNNDPARMDLIIRAMSEEQIEAMLAELSARIEARKHDKSAPGVP